MAKEKFTLQELKVQSFITSLDEDQMNHIKGGYVVVGGKRYSYRNRWTLIDTRSDILTDSMGALNRK